MSAPLRVLFVSDSEDDMEAMSSELRLGGYTPVCKRVANAGSTQAALREGTWDVVVSDLAMAGFDGPSALALVHQLGLDIPFILASEKIDEEQVLAVLKAGASDIILMDNLGRIAPVVERELREAEQRRKRKWAEDKLGQMLDGLERLVEDRTAQLVVANELLRREIDDRERAEQEIRRSEQRYRTLVDQAPVGILSVGTDGTITEVNQKLLEILGSPSAEATKSINMFTFPPLVQAGISSFFKRCLDECRVDSCEIPYTSAWGTHSYLRFLVRPLKDTEGNIYGCQAVIEDFTEKKTAEDRLRLLATAVEQSAESVVITDTSGTIEYVNPAFEQITGYSQQEVIGQNPRILKSGEQDSAFYDRLWRTIAAGEVWSGILVNRRKDGSLYHEDAIISPVRAPQGEIVNYVAVKRNITREVDLRNQLFQAQKMEAVGTLAGGIAHDFNNLLTIMQGYTELVLVDMDGKSPGFPELQAVMHAAGRGAELVKQILTFSRKVETSFRPTNLNREVQKAQELLSRTIPKMISVQLNLANDLKYVNADPGQMEQVIVNLAVNAKDALPDTGGKIVIETRNLYLDDEYCRMHIEARPGHHVLLSFWDSGEGMAKEVLDHIFEPFFTTKKPGEGTGLGLAMVFGIVKGHGGHVTCQSKPGAGTTFNVFLPAIVEKERTPVSATLQMPAFGSETILVVDDEEVIRELGRRLLTRAGYKVLTAGTGTEALEIYRSQREEIALILLDLIMPEMGGKQCFEKLLKLDPNVKVLFASGYSADTVIEESSQGAAKGFVAKPFDIKKFLKTVRDVLDRL